MNTKPDHLTLLAHHTHLAPCGDHVCAASLPWPCTLRLLLSALLLSALLLSALLLSALLVMAVLPSPAAAASRYEDLKQQLDALPDDAKRSRLRDPWQRLAQGFLEVYDAEKKWNNRPAALYRSAMALDELARRSGMSKDAQLADERYLLLAKEHPDSVLADDALFKAAQMRAEVLRDLKGARDLLQQIRTRFAKGDMAEKAAKYDVQLVDEQGEEGTRADDADLPRRQPVKTILLDPGHGGKDPGTHHNGILEHVVALDLSKRVGNMLAAKGYTVRYTRQSDGGISLEDRTNKVGASKADLFVSIHVNANNVQDISGVETYYLDAKSASKGSRLSAVENAMRNRGKEKIGKLPPWTLLRMHNRDAPRLARSVHRAVMAQVGAQKYATVDGGVKTAPFQVLRQAGVPAVLIETGYCSNKAEARNLSRKAYRAALAKGIASGIMAYARSN